MTTSPHESSPCETHYLKTSSAPSGISSTHPDQPPHLSPRQLLRLSEGSARELIDFQTAHRLKVLPLSYVRRSTGSQLVVACTSSLSTEALKELRFAAMADIQQEEVNIADFEFVLFASYFQDQEQLKQAAAKLSTSIPAPEKLDFSAIDLHAPALPPDVSGFFKATLRFALSVQASDLHFVPVQEGALLRVRVDGSLLTSHEPFCSSASYAQLLRFILVRARLDGTTPSIPRSGRISLTFGKQQLPLRVSTIPSVHGPSLTLRLPRLRGATPLDELAMPAHTREICARFVKQQKGLVLVTGATGSGKTTLLHALVTELQRDNCHVLTLEDPVEVLLEGITQVEVSQPELSFQEGLKAALRMDPDAIMVGEIREKTTALLAVEAAHTGHAVVTSCHAGSVIETFLRLERLGVAPESLLSCCNSVHSLKLVPLLCPECKRRIRPDLSEFVAVGCTACHHTGYYQRRLLAESLELSPELCSILSAQKPWNAAELNKALTPYLISLKAQLKNLYLLGQIDARTLHKG